MTTHSPDTRTHGNSLSWFCETFRRLSVPDECYSGNVPDEGYSRNVTDIFIA